MLKCLVYACQMDYYCLHPRHVLLCGGGEFLWNGVEMEKNMKCKLTYIMKENRALLIFLAATAFLMLCSIIWVYHVKVLNAPKVYSDGFGYYVYLPAMIYRDFSFDFVEGWEHPLDLIQSAGGIVNKYPVGVAIMESPFFFLAHIISLLRDTMTGSVTATG